MNRRQLLRAAPLVAISALLGKDKYMSWASDDLASVIIQPNLEFAGWGQGVIEAWNPNTFENIIQYRGAQHENLPVASGVEALTYQVGDVVMLSRWQPTGGGATTLRIGAGGRVIVPGTGAAEKAVAFMRTTLAAQISAQILAERTETARVEAAESLSETDLAYHDLDTPGPSVTVPVSAAGTAIVHISGGMLWSNVTGTARIVGGGIGFEVSGATTRPADVDEEFGEARLLPAGSQAQVKAGITVVVDGLNEGMNTFKLVYRNRDMSGSTTFFSRNLAVLAL